MHQNDFIAELIRSTVDTLQRRPVGVGDSRDDSVVLFSAKTAGKGVRLKMKRVHCFEHFRPTLFAYGIAVEDVRNGGNGNTRQICHITDCDCGFGRLFPGFQSGHRRKDLLLCFFRERRLVAQDTGNRCRRNTCCPCDLLDGCHSSHLPFVDSEEFYRKMIMRDLLSYKSFEIATIIITKQKRNQTGCASCSIREAGRTTFSFRKRTARTMARISGKQHNSQLT